MDINSRAYVFVLALLTAGFIVACGGGGSDGAALAGTEPAAIVYEGDESFAVEVNWAVDELRVREFEQVFLPDYTFAGEQPVPPCLMWEVVPLASGLVGRTAANYVEAPEVGATQTIHIRIISGTQTAPNSCSFIGLRNVLNREILPSDLPIIIEDSDGVFGGAYGGLVPILKEGQNVTFPIPRKIESFLGYVDPETGAPALDAEETVMFEQVSGPQVNLIPNADGSISFTVPNVGLDSLIDPANLLKIRVTTSLDDRVFTELSFHIDKLDTIPANDSRFYLGCLPSIEGYPNGANIEFENMGGIDFRDGDFNDPSCNSLLWHSTTAGAVRNVLNSDTRDFGRGGFGESTGAHVIAFEVSPGGAYVAYASNTAARLSGSPRAYDLYVATVGNGTVRKITQLQGADGRVGALASFQWESANQLRYFKREFDEAEVSEFVFQASQN